MTYNMFSEGIGRYNVVVDQFTNASTQAGDILLTNPQENDGPEYDIHSVWEFKKTNLFSHLNLYNGDQILLMNVATGEYITYHRNSKKAKLSLVP